MQKLIQSWYQPSLTIFTCLLLPFSWIFLVIILIRKYLYKLKIKKSYHFPVPIIIVGNITVGGTGKTPLVIWLANFLKSQGFKPGIVSRGFGGKKNSIPRLVLSSALANEVGDEAILLAQHSQCPVVVSVDRVSAVKKILQEADCNVIISDDGLQHYRLARDIEIAVIDGVRRLGNEKLLPAGPLRETKSRLKTVDFVIVNGQAQPQEYEMQLQGTQIISLAKQEKIVINDFKNITVHAVAAIGNPERFFLKLQQAGLTIIPHVFPDHYLFKEQDLNFNDQLPILMTEKDAVKCVGFAKENYFYLPVSAKLPGSFAKAFLSKLIMISKEKSFIKRLA